jgi:hypothetical protein
MIFRSSDGYIKVRRYVTTSVRFGQCLVGVFFSALLGGCASTTTTLIPSPQATVCDSTAAALILWAPQWRPDQKDTAQREEAAATGLTSFLAGSGCFAHSELRRVPDISRTFVDAQAAAAVGQFTQVVVVGVRELGPVVKLLSSAALVEGGTEVVLQVTSRSLPGSNQSREFTVHWRNGGPGVVKGVASLPADMQAALAAGLKPGTAAK